MNNPNHIPQKEFERIEQYILGHLNAQDMEGFELEMEENELLRQNYKEVKALILAVEEGALRNTLDNFHQEMTNSEVDQTPSKKINAWAWAAAAAIALCIAGAVWILYPSESFHSRQFAQFYIEDPGLITAMSSESSYDFDRAMVEYKSGNYQEAIKRWEKLYQSNPENDTLNYFLGSAHLAKEETEPAIAYFQKVTQLPEGRFTDDNYWYLALSYLKLGRMEDAVNALYKTDHPLKEKLLNSIHEQ